MKLYIPAILPMVLLHNEMAVTTLMLVYFGICNTINIFHKYSEASECLKEDETFDLICSLLATVILIFTCAGFLQWISLYS